MPTVNSYDRPDNAPRIGGQVRSTTSVLAILAAAGSFLLSFQGYGFFALIAALFAMGAGLFGGIKALSPRVSGGMMSIAAVMLGAVSILVAILVMIF